MPPSEIICGGRSASRSSANRLHGPVRRTRSTSASVESKSSKSASVAQTRSKYSKSASVNDSFAIKSPSDPPILHHLHGTVRQTRSKSASVGRKSRKSATVKNSFSVKSPSDPPILQRQSSRLSKKQGNIPPSSPPHYTLKRGSAHQQPSHLTPSRLHRSNRIKNEGNGDSTVACSVGGRSTIKAMTSCGLGSRRIIPSPTNSTEIKRSHC